MTTSSRFGLDAVATIEIAERLGREAAPSAEHALSEDSRNRCLAREQWRNTLTRKANCDIALSL